MIMVHKNIAEACLRAIQILVVLCINKENLSSLLLY